MWNRFKTAWKMAKQMEEKSLTPMGTLPSWKSNKPVWKEWDTDNAVRYGYKASTWVYSCINRIAKTAASVPWKVYRRDPDGELEEIPNHPLEQLLKEPNPYMSGQDLMERMVSHLYLGGNTLLSKVRARNVTAELWPLNPSEFSPVPSNNDFIVAYEYQVNGIKKRLEAEEVLHIMFVDPSNVYWGMAPLQAVARSVDTDSELLDFQKISLQNRAITDGVFSFKQPLTEQQWKEARQMVREQHMGAGNARTPWVLGGEATWQQMSLSPAEMDFIESRRYSREEICSVFQVPPPLVGLYDNATLANIETARKIFWLDTIIPLLEDLKSSFNLSLVKEFGDDIVLSYDVSNVQAIQDNYKEKVDTAKTLWAMGVPFNEINQRLQLGFDEIEGGEVGYLPLNVALAGAGSPAEEDVNVNVDVAENEDGNGERLLNRYVPVTRKKAKGANGSKAWNLETEEQKELFWKNTDARRSNWEEQYAKRIQNLFDEEGDEIAWVFEQHGAEDALAQIDVRSEQWEQLYKAMALAIIEDFGEQTWDLLKAQKPPKTKAFDPWDQLIQAWIGKMAAEKITGILDTTKDLIRNVIALGQEEGLGVTQIAKNIRDRYAGFSRRRSETIARTETVAASNYGSMEAARQTGLNPMKVWVSSRDPRVRDTHKSVDGVTLEMNEEFKVGMDSMMHPGGGSRAEENVHCRCTLSYRVVR